MAAPYLTEAQAAPRLGAYSLSDPDEHPSDAFLKLASDEIDEYRSLMGGPYDLLQPRAFPRSITVADDTEGQVPERILDFVSLRAYQLANEDDPPVITESVKGLSTTFTRGRKTLAERIMPQLLRPYVHRGSVKIIST